MRRLNLQENLDQVSISYLEANYDFNHNDKGVWVLTESNNPKFPIIIINPDGKTTVHSYPTKERVITEFGTVQDAVDFIRI